MIRWGGFIKNYRFGNRKFNPIGYSNKKPFSAVLSFNYEEWRNGMELMVYITYRENNRSFAVFIEGKSQINPAGTHAIKDCCATYIASNFYGIDLDSALEHFYSLYPPITIESY